MQRFPEILGAVERPRVVLRVLSSAGAAADASDDDRPADASASDDSDDDRPITEPFGNAPRDAGRFDEFAFREASAPPRSPRPEAVPESVGEIPGRGEATPRFV